MIFNKHLIHRDGKEEILQEKNFKMRHIMSIINTIQVTKNLIVNILYLIYHYISYYFTTEKTIRNTSSFGTSDTTHNSNYQL